MTKQPKPVVTATLPSGKKITASSMRDLRYKLQQAQIQIELTNRAGDIRTIDAFLDYFPDSEDYAFAKASALSPDWVPRMGTRTFTILAEIVADVYSEAGYHESFLFSLQKAGFIQKQDEVWVATEKAKNFINTNIKTRKTLRLDHYQWMCYLEFLTGHNFSYNVEVEEQQAQVKVFSVLGLITQEPKQQVGIPKALAEFCQSKQQYFTDLGYASFKEMLPDFIESYSYYFSRSHTSSAKSTSVYTSIVPSSEVAIILVKAPQLAEYFKPSKQTESLVNSRSDF